MQGDVNIEEEKVVLLPTEISFIKVGILSNKGEIVGWKLEGTCFLFSFFLCLAFLTSISVFILLHAILLSCF
jgi:hypothetical protein